MAEALTVTALRPATMDPGEHWEGDGAEAETGSEEGAREMWMIEVEVRQANPVCR